MILRIIGNGLDLDGSCLSLWSGGQTPGASEEGWQRNKGTAPSVSDLGKIFLGLTRYSQLKFNRLDASNFGAIIFLQYPGLPPITEPVKVPSRSNWSNFRPQKWAPVDRFIMMSGRWSMGFRLQRLLLTVNRSCWDRLKKKIFINQVSLAKSWEIRFQSLAFGCGITVSILAWLQSLLTGGHKKGVKNWSGREYFLRVQVLFMLFDMCTSESNITCMAMHRRINQSLNLLTHQNGWHFCGETQRLCARRFPDSFCPKIDLNGAHKGKSGAMTWDVRHVVKPLRHGFFFVQKRKQNQRMEGEHGKDWDVQIPQS